VLGFAARPAAQAGLERSTLLPQVPVPDVVREAAERVGGSAIALELRVQLPAWQGIAVVPSLSYS